MPRTILGMRPSADTVADDHMTWGDPPADYEFMVGGVERNAEFPPVRQYPKTIKKPDPDAPPF